MVVNTESGKGDPVKSFQQPAACHFFACVPERATDLPKQLFAATVRWVFTGTSDCYQIQALHILVSVEL